MREAPLWKRSGWRKIRYSTVPWGNANQNQCDQTSSFSHALKLPGVPSARWSRRVGVTPPPSRRSALTG